MTIIIHTAPAAKVKTVLPRLYRCIPSENREMPEQAVQRVQKG